jgi:hypothetical protein
MRESTESAERAAMREGWGEELQPSPALRAHGDRMTSDRILCAQCRRTILDITADGAITATATHQKELHTTTIARASVLGALVRALGPERLHAEIDQVARALGDRERYHPGPKVGAMGFYVRLR